MMRSRFAVVTLAAVLCSFAACFAFPPQRPLPPLRRRASRGVCTQLPALPRFFGDWWRVSEDRGPRCAVCEDTEVIPCPNCAYPSEAEAEAEPAPAPAGYYISYGRLVPCNCCKTTGRVICRACFRGDPWDIGAIREKMRNKPD